MASSLAAPRAPAASLDAALYESHYLTATEPSGGRALWLRHTALKRPGAPARATVWLTWFDREAPAPVALRETAAAPLADPGGAWSRSPLGVLSSGSAQGALDGASWELGWEANAPELPYLPARWLYDRAIPRSNGAALVPAGVANGTADVGGRAVDLDGWDVVVGHNWGSEHAEEWSWIHAAGLGDDRSGWLDLALARVRVGPVSTPWLATGAVHLAGRTVTTARRGSVRRTVAGEHTAVAVPLRDGGALELALDAPERATVEWDYASPRGAGRIVRNCSIADAAVTVRTAHGDSSFAVEGAAAVEHGRPAGTAPISEAFSHASRTAGAR